MATPMAIVREDADLAVLAVDTALVRALVASGAAAEISEEQERRRRQHREEMVRYRWRKKSGLESMRVEEKELSRRLKRILRLRATSSGREDGPVRPPTTLTALAEALVAKERLRQESFVLQRRWSELAYFENFVRNESAKSRGGQDRVEAHERSGSQLERADGGGWKTFLEGEPPFYFVPFTEHECRAHVSDNARRVFGLQRKHAACSVETAAAPANASANAGPSSVPTSDAAVVHFFGWRVHLEREWNDALQQTTIRYKFCKTFRLPMRTVEQVVDRMWEVLHSPALFQALYAVPVHLIVLQSWRDDLSVTLWNTPSPDRSRRSRAASLYSRSLYTNPHGDECVLLMINALDLKQPRTGPLGPSTTQTGEPIKYTNHGRVYNVFKRGKENDTVELEHCGHVDVLNETIARYLMVELGCTLVRLENLMFPMRVLQNGVCAE